MVFLFNFLESKDYFTDLSFGRNHRGTYKTVFINVFCFFSVSCCFSFSISFSNSGCRWMGIGLPLCCISLYHSFSWTSTSTVFTVLFFVKSLWNLLFSVPISAPGLLLIWFGLFTRLTVWCGVSVSSVIPIFPSS